MPSGLINLHKLNAYRVRHRLHGGMGDETVGSFDLPSPAGGRLHVIATAGESWDHVSVSRPDRPPSWDEMSAMHRRFFQPDATAMQLHVPASRHINVHPHCLHLWRPWNAAVPTPPEWLV